MMQNRKPSKIKKGYSLVRARLWQARFAIVLAMAYGLLFSWLFSGTYEEMQGRPIDFSALPESPVWEAPDADHRFGTTADGTDLYVLSRAAMAQGSAFAVVVSTLGVLLGFLISLLFVFDGGSRFGAHVRDRFTLLRSVSRFLRLLPAMMVFCIVLGGSGAGPVLLFLSSILVVGLYSSETIAEWFEKEDRRPDRISGEVLGLHRPRIIKSRSIPVISRRLIGLVATLLPVVILAEMALAFLGFTGGSLSCGVLVASGTSSLLEAPWVTIYPGLFAGVIVLLFSVLGRVTNFLLRGGTTPDFL